MTRKNRKVTIPVGIGYRSLTDIMVAYIYRRLAQPAAFLPIPPLSACRRLKRRRLFAIARIVDTIVSLFMGSFTDHFIKTIWVRIWPAAVSC